MRSLSKFTVCYWMKSTASNDGTVLSYAVPGQHNELLFFDHTNVHVYIAGDKRFDKLISFNRLMHGPKVITENPSSVLLRYA